MTSTMSAGSDHAKTRIAAQSGACSSLDQLADVAARWPQR